MRVVIIKENFLGCEIAPDSRLGIWTVFNAGRLRIRYPLSTIPMKNAEWLTHRPLRHVQRQASQLSVTHLPADFSCDQAVR
jgi:hypothetical protein